MKFYLDGVAATTKTTTLRLLQEKHPEWRVGFSDYYDFVQELKNDRIGECRERNTLIYTLKRCTEQFDESKVNITDRHPASSLAYSFVFDPLNFNEQKTERAFAKIKDMVPGWRGIVLLPVPGQEHLVVKLMKKRNNGIDLFTKDYVVAQSRVFEVWARVMQAPVRYIDYTESLDEQQARLIAEIEKMVETNA